MIMSNTQDILIVCQGLDYLLCQSYTEIASPLYRKLTKYQKQLAINCDSTVSKMTIESKQLAFTKFAVISASVVLYITPTVAFK